MDVFISINKELKSPAGCGDIEISNHIYFIRRGHD